MAKDDDDGKEHWHIEKGIPITIILTFFMTIAVQSAVIAYNYGKLSENVGNNARDIGVLTEGLPRLVKLEATMDNVSTTLEEIKDELKEARRGKK